LDGVNVEKIKGREVIRVLFAINISEKAKKELEKKEKKKRLKNEKGKTHRWCY